jgi:hypothetical protein
LQSTLGGCGFVQERTHDADGMPQWNPTHKGEHVKVCLHLMPACQFCTDAAAPHIHMRMSAASPRFCTNAAADGILKSIWRHVCMYFHKCIKNHMPIYMTSCIHTLQCKDQSGKEVGYTAKSALNGVLYWGRCRGKGLQNK